MNTVPSYLFLDKVINLHYVSIDKDDLQKIKRMQMIIILILKKFTLIIFKEAAYVYI